MPHFQQIICFIIVVLFGSPMSVFGQTTVTGESVKTQEIGNTLSLVGSVKPVQSVKIQSKLSGRIKHIYVKENSQVQKDDLLISLDNIVERLQVERAKTFLEIQKKNLENAQANFEDTERKLKEEELLYKRGSTTKSRLDEIRLQHMRTQIARDTAKMNVLLAETDLSVREQTYQDTVLQSPFSGIIARRYVDPGEVINGGALLFDLIDLSQVELETSITEEEIQLVSKGQKATFTTPAYPKRQFQGTVDRVSWKADPQNRRFQVYVLATNPQQWLREGMTVQIALKDNAKSVRLIPLSAVKHEGNQSYVYVLEEQQAFRRNIETGNIYGSKVVVLKGVNVGEIVVSSHQGPLRTGINVEVQNSVQ